MTSFPNIAPSDRTFQDGFFYLAQQQFREGGSFRKQYGQLLQEGGLTLTFENIDDAIAAAFVDAYNACGGGLRPVTLPPDFLAGMTSQLQSLVGGSGSWFVSDAVQVRSVRPGVSTVTIELVSDTISSLFPARVSPDSSSSELFGFEFLRAWRLLVYTTGRAIEKRVSNSWGIIDLIGISLEWSVTDSWPLAEDLIGVSLEYGCDVFVSGELLTGAKV